MDLFRTLITLGLLISKLTLFLKKDSLRSWWLFICSTPFCISVALPCRVAISWRYPLHGYFRVPLSQCELQLQAVARHSWHLWINFDCLRKQVQRNATDHWSNCLIIKSHLLLNNSSNYHILGCPCCHLGKDNWRLFVLCLAWGQKLDTSRQTFLTVAALNSNILLAPICLKNWRI